MICFQIRIFHFFPPFSSNEPNKIGVVLEFWQIICKIRTPLWNLKVCLLCKIPFIWPQISKSDPKNMNVITIPCCARPYLKLFQRLRFWSCWPLFGLFFYPKLAVSVRQKFVIHLLLSFFSTCYAASICTDNFSSMDLHKRPIFWHLYSEHNMIITPCFITISTYTHINLSLDVQWLRLWIRSKTFFYIR